MPPWLGGYLVTAADLFLTEVTAGAVDGAATLWISSSTIRSIAMSGVTIAAAATSETLSVKAAALALGSLSGTGRSLLSACTADRPLGVTLAAAAASATLSINAALPLSRKQERHRPLAARRVHR